MENIQRSEYPEICVKLINSLYCDDISTGGHSINETVKLYEVSKRMMCEGGFNLRKWRSNSPEVMKIIQEITDLKSANLSGKEPIIEDDQSYANSVVGKNKSNEATEAKILGVAWDTCTDDLKFELSSLTKITKEAPVTERNILKTLASLFDPLELLTPISTPLKVLLQNLFEQKMGWDDIAPEDIVKEWKSMMSQFDNIKYVSVPRYYFGNLQAKPQEIELFGFCDSSNQAYTALVYAKVINR